MTRRPTIRDISRLTGLSNFSVSQALAGKPGVAQPTRERVLQVAADIGYLPNRIAANLREATSRTVGILTADRRNQYYAMLVQSIDVVLQSEGYHAVSNDSMRGQTYVAAAERAGVEELLQQRVAAVIATYSLAPDSLALLQRWNVPVVFVDSLPPPGADGYPFVGVDNFAASAAVAHYLADLGHESSVFLGYPPEWNTRQERERGFSVTARSRGMRVKIVEADNSAGSAESAMAALLAQPRPRWPTAVYATNIVLLQGTLKAIKHAAADIPGDISVVGFDDFDWAELIDPPMTVVDQHISALGAAAGRAVLDVIKNDGAPDHRRDPVLFQADLIARESCAAPRAKGSKVVSTRRRARVGDSRRLKPGE